MKYFSKFFMTNEHIKVLRDSRKIFVKTKVINHNNNVIEVTQSEKGYRVFPENDELLTMIDNIKRFDYVIHAIKTGEYRNYYYDELPTKLKKYMWEKDALFFSQWLAKQKRSPISYDYENKEEKITQLYGQVDDEMFTKFVLLGSPIPSTIGKKAKDSSKRAYQTVLSLVKSNVHLFMNFVTLTFAHEQNKIIHLENNKQRKKGEYDLNFQYINGTDFELAKKAYSDMVNNLSKQLRNKGIPFEYLSLWELQKNGYYHFHMLTTEIPKEFLYQVPEWLDYDYKKQVFNFGKGLIVWKYGKSDVQKIKSKDRITTYLSKYILKSFLNVNEENYEEYLNKRKYFPSKNLIKSKEDYIDEQTFDKILKEMEFEKIEPFEKTYINPYNKSQIDKKIFTLM